MSSTTSSPTSRKAWVTLLTKGDHYLPGLAVFADSLKRSAKGGATSYDLVVMVTDDMSLEGRKVMEQLGCKVVLVDYLNPKVLGKNLAESRFADVWTKLRAFSLTEYDRVVLVDSDMLVLRNMDELLELQLEQGMEIAAGFACTCNPNRIKTYPDDWIPENCAFTPQRHPEALTAPTRLSPTSPPTHKLLNSGLVVLQPSKEAMEAMEARTDVDKSIEDMRFPDQDFLAAFYDNRWQPLPWFYNALKKLRQVHPELWRDDEVRNIHFILNKPWAHSIPPSDPDHYLHSLWWDAWRDLVSSGRGGVDEELFNDVVARHVNEGEKKA